MKNHILIVEDDEAIQEGVIASAGGRLHVQEAEDGFSVRKSFQQK